ncbi:N-acetyltransferase [Citrus sinensis]|uniref:N-acetyltransferase n=1 Tax=Citrus sinensis TaxID=2711 RepID=A0ACB8HZS4_CITSI|nr:N-acetyltransferase [Citrus sinensis]
MAPKKTSHVSQSPIPIGNCEVTVEAKKFTCESDPNTLQISISRTAKIKIAGEEYIFVLVNPKDAEDSCSKSYLQDVLQIYSRELPTMNYAANTGKRSMFLEKCVLNGKYCTLLLKSSFMDDDDVVVAAITYQIVPADTQYAEVPLAAVSSIYQHKGVGRLLYLELRKRLQSVGIRTIFCWGDKESEGFWHKQGFASVAEVDTKGRARRLPIKADIRKVLCFPGGSTLMVSHLDKDTSADTAVSLKFCFPVKPCEKSSLVTVNRSLEAERLVTDGCSRDGAKSSEALHCRANIFCLLLEPVHGSGELAAFENVHCSDMTVGAAQIGTDTGAKHCSCSQGTKRRWEASTSSLKSKKVKGSSCADCHLDSDRSLASAGSETVGLSGCKPSREITPSNRVTVDCTGNDAKEDRPVCTTSAAFISKEFQSNGKCFRIMLMNIADDSKKVHLTKVIEDLGGAVTSDGSTSTHVVTGKVRKTLNFLTALCSGAWIVSPNWLKESFREGRFVDESSYMLKDDDYVLKYRSELKDSVLRAKARPGGLLRGYNIVMAAHIQPPIKTLSAIVRSAGGNHKLNVFKIAWR